MEINIGNIIVEEEINLGDLELDVVKEYPSLEDLIVTPSGAKQTFKSKSYGYGNVTVKAVESDTLNIKPSLEEQRHEGLYGEVTVQGVNLQDKELTLNKNGVYNIKADEEYLGLDNVEVTINAIEDLDNELDTYNEEITEQTATIENIVETLKSKGLTIGAEYDRFWDSFQNYGKKTNYMYAFAGDGWTEQTLKPKYIIKPIDTSASTRRAIAMFTYLNRSGDTYFDMDELCKKLDFSQIISAQNMFANAQVKNITVDFSNCTTIQGCFSAGDGGAVNNITLKVSEKCTNMSNVFYYQSTYLTDLKFTDDSVINSSQIDLKRATNLTHESLMSIINALKDYSGTSTTMTIALGETNINKLSDSEKAIASGKGWTLT